MSKKKHGGEDIGKGAGECVRRVVYFKDFWDMWREHLKKQEKRFVYHAKDHPALQPDRPAHRGRPTKPRRS